ncbi:hypothetical protein LCGC14_2151780 [marine sediment metagenome]|uniref:NAD/GMP synthase domain-containing protein n=1 Tax=marine sediment metagenome TaxID=412755 RepID=A0A0F9GRQ5_9ZZZZ
MINDKDGLVKKVLSEIQAQTDIAVLGMSGGADSTLVAILSAQALGRENVYAIHMPYDIDDNATFNAKSVEIANHLGINSKKIWIDIAVDFLSSEVGHLSQLNMGNTKSRIRMVVLYSMACRLGEETGKRVRVVGTDNLSEGYINYFTKHGDGACDFFPIGDLFKSEVYQLLDMFRDEGVITNNMIDRIPSAGLWDSQTDQNEIGYSYDEMEVSIRKLMSEKPPDTKIDNDVNDMHVNGRHKSELIPIIGLRKFCD